MGGQLTTTTEVENYPGYPEGIQGPDMMEDFKKQAERFGTDVRFGIASSVDFSEKNHRVVFDDGTAIEAEAVIIATGATAKYLGLEAEAKVCRDGRISLCYMRRFLLQG
jgi:thioredoxin reductase (NADPH)